MIAYCGLICSECPAYLATKADDNEARVKVAEKWSKEFGGDIKPEQINCEGCTSTGGKVFGYCSQCGIRACGIEKAVPNCGHCTDYACEQLNGFHAQAASAKETLDKIAQEKKRI